jgi:hypothetical protein
MTNRSIKVFIVMPSGISEILGCLGNLPLEWGVSSVFLDATDCDDVFVSFFNDVTR